MTALAVASIRNSATAESAYAAHQPTSISTLPSAGTTPPNLIDPAMAPDLFAIPKTRRLDTSIHEIKPPPTFSLRPLQDFAPSRQTSTEVLAEWNGCVTFIDPKGHSFSASLTGITGEGVKGEEEDAIIPITDVSEWDKSLLKLGNFFRLCVIHEIDPSGQPRRYTQVVFRRLPAYHQHELNQANERGLALARELRVE